MGASSSPALPKRALQYIKYHRNTRNYIIVALLLLSISGVFLVSRAIAQQPFDFSQPTETWNVILPPLSPTEIKTLRKDCDAEGLVRLFNTPNAVNISAIIKMAEANSVFEKKMLYSKFLESLSPWILAEPKARLNHAQRAHAIDCSDANFGRVLTGRTRSSPRPIVDVILFAYDLDMLEIRLLEMYDSVDYYILYEAPFTHQGIDKPMFFNKSLYHTPSRWRHFLSKMIHIMVERKDLAKELQAIREDPNDWGLDISNRRLPLKRLKQPERMDPLSAKNARTLLKRVGDKDMEDVLVITADDDEQILGHVLHHIRHCELKEDVTFPIYFPCVYFKNNVHWLMQTRDYDSKDADCFSSPHYSPQAVKEVMGHLWALRPKMSSLREALDNEHLVTDFLFQCHDTVGFPSAWHMSDVSEPVLWWLKKGGVIEHRLDVSAMFTQEFLLAAVEHRVTPALLADTALQPYCHWRNPGMHTSELSGPAREIVNDAIPWAIRANPARFCWLNPTEHAFSADTRRSTFGSRCPALTLSQHWRRLVASRSHVKEG